MHGDRAIRSCQRIAIPRDLLSLRVQISGFTPLHSPPQIEHPLGVPHNFAPAQLALSVYPIHECDGDFSDGIAESASADDDLHLKDVAF